MLYIGLIVGLICGAVIGFKIAALLILDDEMDEEYYG